MKKILIFISLCIFLFLFSILVMIENNVSSYTDSKYYYGYYNVSYGNHQRNKLDLTLPKNDTNGLILFIHGGSWMSGDKESYRNNLVDWTINNGFAACAINYRYVTGIYSYDDILEDISKSLMKVKEIASTKNINLTKLLLTGHSAGGHLSLLYAYSKVDNAPIKPCCVVNLSGPTDLNDTNYYSKSTLKVSFIFSSLTNNFITKSNYFNKDKILNEVSPISFINENTVSTITAHGIKDNVVPYSNATSLHKLLDDNNIDNILIPFINSGHGLENDNDSKNKLDYLMIEYAKKYLS